MLLGNKPLPEPMSIHIYVTIWRHKATVSSEFRSMVKPFYNNNLFLNNTSKRHSIASMWVRCLYPYITGYVNWLLWISGKLGLTTTHVLQDILATEVGYITALSHIHLFTHRTLSLSSCRVTPKHETNKRPVRNFMSSMGLKYHLYFFHILSITFLLHYMELHMIWADLFIIWTTGPIYYLMIERICLLRLIIITK